MTISEEVELILDNINELYSQNINKKNKVITNKEKAIKYIVNLAKNRKNKKISASAFLEELLSAQLKFHTHFGKDFEKYIECIAVDLDGIGKTWRKLDKKIPKEK